MITDWVVTGNSARHIGMNSDRHSITLSAQSRPAPRATLAPRPTLN